MRKIVIVGLVILLMLQSGIRSYVILNYYLNKDFVVSNFCKNRTEVNNHCKGSCYLKRELQKHDHETSDGKVFIEKLEKEVWIVEASEIIISVGLNSEVTHSSYCLIKKYVVSLGSLFKPPRLIS